MHAKPDLRVALKWMIAGSGSVITDVITLKSHSMAKEVWQVLQDEAYPNMPNLWLRVRGNLKESGPAQYGFASTTGVPQYNRFVHRFRLAKSLSAVVLDDYSDDVATKYHAGYRLFTTVTAFERFADLFGVQWYNATAHLKPAAMTDAFNEWLDTDPDQEIATYFETRVSPQLQTRLANLKSGTGDEIFALAVAIRHKFSHGQLASDIFWATADFPKLALALSNHLLDGMDIW